MFRPSKLIENYFKVNMRRAGLKKHFVTIMDDDNKPIKFCYCEKGTKVPHQPSIIFIHGFSSDKHTWSKMIKHVPDNYHCISIDMPCHGETVGFNPENLTSDNVVNLLKQFFDKLGLIEPMCFVGNSMGGSMVAMFATKYSSYVGMICLLSPVPPGEEFQNELTREICSGNFEILLPETREQLYTTLNALSMKKVRLRRIVANELLKLRLPFLDQHKKVLKIAFENDYPNLHRSYEPLKDLTCPALIIWGLNDRLCAVEGAYYFYNAMMNVELVFLEDCGHLISLDKPKETMNSIIGSLQRHHSTAIRL